MVIEILVETVGFKWIRLVQDLGLCSAVSSQALDTNDDVCNYL